MSYEQEFFKKRGKLLYRNISIISLDKHVIISVGGFYYYFNVNSLILNKILINIVCLNINHEL